MSDELISYKYLWDGSCPEWCLVDVSSDDKSTYQVVNTQTKMVMLIEDEELANMITKRMLSANVKVISLTDLKVILATDL